jgi:type I restriction enzyme S subunit
MSEWKQTTLGDETDLLTGFPFQSSEYSTDTSQPKLVRGDNVVQGRLRWENSKHWDVVRTKGLEPYFLEAGDIVLAMDRPWIEAGLKYSEVTKHDLPALLVQRVSRFRGTNSVISKYIKYVIGSRGFTDYIQNVQTGTAVPHISSGQIRNFCFLLPPLHEQKAIAAILGALDGKIELNRRMNATLEAMARALFKSWFVDFDPVRDKMEGRQPFGIDADMATLFPSSLRPFQLGEIPEGWAMPKFSVLFEIIGGGTPKTSNPEYWSGDIPWFSVVDAPSNTDVFVLQTDKTITQKGVDESSTRILSLGTTIISARGTVGRLALVGQPMAMNQSCYGLSPATGVGGAFLYFSTRKAVAELQSHAHGSVFDTITRDTFDGLTAIKPTDAVMTAFETLAWPMLEKIRGNLFENIKLKKMRDYLLPKLISGDIRIRDAEKFVEGST